MGQTQQKNRLIFVARSVGIAVLVGLFSFFVLTKLFKPLDLFATDLLFRFRGPIQDDTPVMLVGIDNSSFDYTQLRWPWPRDYIAKIVDGIVAGDPKVLVLDIFFYEPSTPEQDQALADALSKARNVVLVNDISTDQSVSGTFAASTRTLNEPIPVLRDVATLGLTNFPTDEDGKVRTLLAFQAYGGELYYSWALQASRLYLGADSFNVVSQNEVLIGDHPVELDHQFLHVNYRGPALTLPSYSAYQVADGLMDPSVFKDKIVILGTTSESLHDSYPVPFGGSPMPGAEINGNAIDTILADRYLHPVGVVGSLLLALAAAAIGVLLTVRTRPVTGLLVVLVLLLAYGFTSFMLFTLADVILPHVGPAFAIVLTFVANTSIQLYEERRQRQRVRSLFDRYVSSAAIDQMLDQPDSFGVGGGRREMSIMFSDIRGFTSLSEQLAPDQVVSILNEYLAAMTEVIFKHHGTIDKFEGDAILAIWNAPLEIEDFPVRCVECAIDMAHRLREMQSKWAATGQLVLRNGIGITTGTVFVGNIGSEQRMDYTVIGDTVNLASRLEALTKEVGVQILYNKTTHERLADKINSRYVASAVVKGREQPVEIYTPDPAMYDLHVEEGVSLDQMPSEITQIEK